MARADNTFIGTLRSRSKCRSAGFFWRRKTVKQIIEADVGVVSGGGG
jgi:hypothetical protein